MPASLWYSKSKKSGDPMTGGKKTAIFSFIMHLDKEVSTRRILIPTTTTTPATTTATATISTTNTKTKSISKAAPWSAAEKSFPAGRKNPCATDSFDALYIFLFFIFLFRSGFKKRSASSVTQCMKPRAAPVWLPIAMTESQRFLGY